MGGTMAETVWKYQICNPGIVTKIACPVGAEPLSVGLQDDFAGERLPGGIVIWMRVDSNGPLETRRFIAIGTGRLNGVPLGRFVGRVTQGPFEWHVFEVREPVDGSET